MCSIASKFGMTSEPLRISVRRAEVDGGKRPGVTSEESDFARSNGENRELRPANEISG
jgi:transposase